MLPVPFRRLAYQVAHRMLRTWWYIRRPPLHGVKCVITDEDRVLLVRHTYGNREWDLPGGTPRRGEPPFQAATREMEEELGVTITDWQPLGDLLRVSWGCQDTLHCFRAELTAPTLTANRAEIAAERWFPQQELPDPLGRHVRPVLALARVTPTPDRTAS
jgi:8-oxo-dGTP pyrophosphatase MutT (NUDIX family)